MAVDVLGDLGNQHHQADRRRLFPDQGAEIDRLGDGGAESFVDGGEQGAAAGAVVWRVGETQPQAGGVVELGGVQADVGVADGETVTHDAGAGDAEAAAVVRCGPGDGGGEERKERIGREQRTVAARDEGAGKGLDRHGIRARGSEGELRVEGLERLADA